MTFLEFFTRVMSWLYCPFFLLPPCLLSWPVPFSRLPGRLWFISGHHPARRRLFHFCGLFSCSKPDIVRGLRLLTRGSLRRRVLILLLVCEDQKSTAVLPGNWNSNLQSELHSLTSAWANCDTSLILKRKKNKKPCDITPSLGVFSFGSSNNNLAIQYFLLHP